MATAEEKSMIDRVYDVADEAANAIGHALGVDLSEPETANAPKLDTPRAPSSRQIPAISAPAAPVRGPFHVIEAIDHDTGKPVFTVTNGVERHDCATRKFADDVIAALRAKGQR